jgi:hypothetical protein
MSASTDLRQAQLERECERIMRMSIEEMAAEEGKTVAQLLEEGRRIGEEMLKRIRSRYPDFRKPER